jgi:hypothetical protein
MKTLDYILDLLGKILIPLIIGWITYAIAKLNIRIE